MHLLIQWVMCVVDSNEGIWFNLLLTSTSKPMSHLLTIIKSTKEITSKVSQDSRLDPKIAWPASGVMSQSRFWS